MKKDKLETRLVCNGINYHINLQEKKLCCYGLSKSRTTECEYLKYDKGLPLCNNEYMSKSEIYIKTIK